MPAFIKTPADEKRWSKAKAAANKTHSESEGDRYWALVNSIYQKMTKSDEDIEALEAVLTKARRRLSDEPEDPDEAEEPMEEQGFREFDPEEDDEAQKWLEEHDPQELEGEGDDDQGEDDYYQEYAPDEDEESHQQAEEPAEEAPVVEEPAAPAPAAGSVPAEEPKAQPEKVSEGRFPQPTKEEIAEMRQYTRPWEQRARDAIRLRAEASKNPVLHHEGKLLEARNQAHKSHQDAYATMQQSPEYQQADPITQMEMDSQFESKWHKENPDYLKQAAQAHGEAHKKGLAAKDVHAAAKDEKIRHILSGGAQPESPMSAEEGLQHAGGVKGEEGTEGSMVQDPASAFAAANKEALAQYAKDYEKKAKKPTSMEDMANYDEKSAADVSRILGEHPNLKDPKKKAAVDTFFQKYHPLIAMNAHKTLNALGLDHKKHNIDLGQLHEAGMHGLMQAINDYEHGHASGASFATHAGNKIRGLQQTAMRDMDEIPYEVRKKLKQYSPGSPTMETFHQQPSPHWSGKPSEKLSAMVAKHPPEIADRMKRINTFKQVQAPKTPKPEGGTNE